MEPTPRLTLATVLFGGEEVLLETMPTWREAVDRSPVAVVAIDNSVDGGASEILRRALPTALVLERADNPGFAASANEAFDRSSTAWVLLLNADVHLTAAALAACLSWIDDPDRDARTECGAVSLVTRGQEHCGVELNAVGYFSDRPTSSARPPLGPSGGAMLMTREMFKRVGGFEADLFAWGEDAGLSLRLFSTGARTLDLPLGLQHVGGHSVASLAGLRFKARLLSRNRVRLMRRQWSRPLFLLLGPYQMALIMANGVRKMRAGTASAHFRGVVDALIEQPRPSRIRFGIRDHARYRAGAAARDRPVRDEAPAPAAR